MVSVCWSTTSRQQFTVHAQCTLYSTVYSTCSTIVQSEVLTVPLLGGGGLDLLHQLLHLGLHVAQRQVVADHAPLPAQRRHLSRCSTSYWTLAPHHHGHTRTHILPDYTSARHSLFQIHSERQVNSLYEVLFIYRCAVCFHRATEWECAILAQNLDAASKIRKI